MTRADTFYVGLCHRIRLSNFDSEHLNYPNLKGLRTSSFSKGLALLIGLKLNNCPTNLDVFDGLLAGEPVSGNDGGRVDLLLDQLVRVAKEFSGNKDDGGGAVANLLILKLS